MATTFGTDQKQIYKNSSIDDIEITFLTQTIFFYRDFLLLSFPLFKSGKRRGGFRLDTFYSTAATSCEGKTSVNIVTWTLQNLMEIVVVWRGKLCQTKARVARQGWLVTSEQIMRFTFICSDCFIAFITVNSQVKWITGLNQKQIHCKIWYNIELFLWIQSSESDCN